MKKYLVALSILVIFAGVSRAADTSSVSPHGTIGVGIPDRYQGAVPLAGKMPRTWHVRVDNVVRTIDNMVVTANGTYLGGSDNTLSPIAATISSNTGGSVSCWAFYNTPTTSDHCIAAGGSWQPSGSDAIGYLRGVASGADNGVHAITLWY